MVLWGVETADCGVWRQRIVGCGDSGLCGVETADCGVWRQRIVGCGDSGLWGVETADSSETTIPVY